jgi:acyl-CoA synthetase (AMP-forming)/AMP-acid ligase II
VSTIEVESVISSVLEQADSVVYGVDVPGVEGKAGMAAIVEEAGKFDLERFLNRIRAELPAYAIPLFIRLVSTIDITGKATKGVCSSLDQENVMVLGERGKGEGLSCLCVCV